MEEPLVWENQPEIRSAEQMVAQWTVYGVHGQDGNPAQYHVVEELKLLGGGSGKKHKMEEPVVWEIQPDFSSAIQRVAQWIVYGVSGQDGDFARQPVVEELKPQQG